ncbi:putative membrane protein [Xenococcus sp. PCC 7305]|uniref:SHOCT domain-containing protein n=1 Tax=Xenococcus sp. PCC 7305 TaxID=102125 RepID=UPI0002AC957F|nr:SHOCT domain-containing protein [Xenococcus sp. PCC 7305]ELS05261.1 putative membrane protein [Xenococcus sp. PCC 7305]
MLTVDQFFSYHKNRKIAVGLALLSAITPIPGLQKFYLGQPVWGFVYLLLWSSPMVRIACAIDAVLYITQDLEEFNYKFNGIATGEFAINEAQKVNAIAEALRKLDSLREDGLITEYEFEQKRRQLLETS